MRLPTIRRILKDDLAKNGDLPSWIDQLLFPLNQFIDVVTLALRENLDLQNNFTGKLVSLDFTSGTAINIPIPTKSSVIGMIPLALNGNTLESYSLALNSNGTVALTLNFYKKLLYGDITSGSALVSNLSTSGLMTGQTISGVGVPLGTTISSIGSTSVTMSGNASTTIASNPLKFVSTAQAMTVELLFSGG